MTGNSHKYPDFVYEDAIARLEEAQSRVLEAGDLQWAACSASMLAIVAAANGYIPLAEAGHRTAIHAYNLDYAADAFEKGIDQNPTVSPQALDEYIRLAEALYSGSKTRYAHRSLHRLKREALALGPLEHTLATKGIAIVAETEVRLASHSFTRRKAHARSAKQLGSMCAIASQGGGLPLRLVDEYEKPRIVKAWIDDIRRANIL